MSFPVSFLVVDDHPVFRRGLVDLIQSQADYTVVAESGSMDEAIVAMRSESPDMVLVDISLNDKNGLDLVKELKAIRTDVLALVISVHDEVVYAARALRAGARGYVMKHEAASVMLEAIKMVLSGRIYVSTTMRDQLLEGIFHAADTEGTPTVERLSNRELEVLELLGRGYGASEIAANLNLSVKTVTAYRDRLKEKLNIASASHLRKFAISWVQSSRR